MSLVILQPLARLAHADPGLSEAGPCPKHRRESGKHTITDSNHSLSDENFLQNQTLKFTANTLEGPVWF